MTWEVADSGIVEVNTIINTSLLKLRCLVEDLHQREAAKVRVALVEDLNGSGFVLFYLSLVIHEHIPERQTAIAKRREKPIMRTSDRRNKCHGLAAEL